MIFSYLSFICYNYLYAVRCNIFASDKYHTHKLTSNFVDITASHHFLPIITRPTRITSSSATLIDNLFTNNIKKISNPVILIDDISDHLPIFALIETILPLTDNSLFHSERQINVSTKEYFKEILASTDWSDITDLCAEFGPELAYAAFSQRFRALYDKAFPIIKKTTKPTVKFKQPWMTPSLRKSCQTKNKLYALFLRNPTVDNKERFVAYRNKFKSLRKLVEKIFYATQFMKYNNDLKIPG